MLLREVTQQEEIHAKAEVTLQSISCFEKVNLIPPTGILKLGKDEMLKYRYTVESQKSEANNVNVLLEKVEDLVEGICNNFSNVIEEWGIGEIEESLEDFTPKAKDIEQILASSKAKITKLSVLDAEAMEFSVVSPTKLTSQIDEQSWLAKKWIKEIATIMIKGHL